MKHRHRNSWLRQVSQGPLDNLEDQNTRILTVAKAVSTSAFLATPPLDSLKKRNSLIQKLIFHPESSFIFFWNVLLIWLIVYQSFAIPFFIFFGIAISGFIGGLELVITLIFLLDIGLNFNTAVFSKGVFVTNHVAIAKEYIQHWFWLDLLSSFPFSWLSGEFLSETSERRDASTDSSSVSAFFRLFRVLRFMRVLRLVRLAKLKRIFIKIEDYIASTTLANVMQFLRLLFLIFLLAHWTACLWYFVAVNEAEEQGETWVGVILASSQHSTLQIYVTALYFTFATMSTVGYGDVHPYTRNEKIFGILTMVLACGVFAYTVGSISSLLTKSNAEETDHRARVISVNRYMRKQGISLATQFRVRRYLEYLWDNQKNTFLKEREILSQLSGPLRDEIYSHVHGSILLLCPVFELLETLLVSRLSKLLNGETFAPGDIIFAQGETTSKLYFIEAGNVNIYHRETRSSFMTLSVDNYFGEIAFFLGTPRTASAECIDFVDLFSLERDDLKAVAEGLPVSKEKLDILKVKCASGDLSSLSVVCYICTTLGHVSARCTKALINFDHEVSREKWLRAREKKSIYINPHLDPLPNVSRYQRPKLKAQYQARNVKGHPRGSAELFDTDPELLRLAREFQETVHYEVTTASRQATLREETIREPTRPRFSIFTKAEEAEPVLEELRRGTSFRRSLLRRVPPIVEMETFGELERTKSVAATVQVTPLQKTEMSSEERPHYRHFHRKYDEEGSELGSDFRPFLSFGDSDDVNTTVKETGKDTPGLSK